MNSSDSICNIFPAIKDIPLSFRINERIEQREYLLNGELKIWNGPVQKVLSPVCISSRGQIQQTVIGSYPLLGKQEALAALSSAIQAYDHGRGAWPTMTVEQRIDHMERFIFRMNEVRDEVVKILMWEIGKSHADSEREFTRTVAYISDTIRALKELDRNSSRLVIEQGIIGQIRRAPLGIVLCMGPYNYPLNETFSTVIPALIMGNIVIFKPPKLGVLLHRPLLKAFMECFPPGVVNTVYGDGPTVAGPLMESGQIDVLAFIGSSKVSDILRKQHPRPHRLRCILGLEAKNPAIILQDADLDMAVNEVLLGALSFNGQRCTALKIIFVHERIIKEFTEKLRNRLLLMNAGMPWKEDVQITPLPDKGMVKYMKDLVEDARAKGAEIINEYGGTINETFFYPAVLVSVNRDMRIYHEEQFGPIIPLIGYNDLQVPLEYIVQSNFGQQVSIFGKDPDQVACLTDPLTNQVCRVNLNSQCQRGPDIFPFTGRKDSAENTLSVSDALRVFTIRSLVAAKDTTLNKDILRTILRERKSNFLSTDYIL